METKSDIDWLKMVRGRYGFQESHIVPSNGSSGGWLYLGSLGLRWKYWVLRCPILIVLLMRVTILLDGV